MAYNELIKNFERIRDYMREFYVYGFKSRDEYSSKSARSYDNERRRIESWLGEYMSFRQDATGKNVFISVDSRNIVSNPLFKAFKAKSFTDYDIILHFYILDILVGGKLKGVHEIIDDVADYLARMRSDIIIDDSTVRKKLKEYEQLGILQSERCGRELKYRIVKTDINEDGLKDAIAFMAEEDPMGAIGSYCLDRYEDVPDYLRHKHHYILGALDSQVLYELLAAISEHRMVDINLKGRRMEKDRDYFVLPMKIYSSTQSGRSYLLSYVYAYRKFIFMRLDSIHKIKQRNCEKHFEEFEQLYEHYKKNLWGVSIRRNFSTDHVEMTVHVDPGEDHIVRRLMREKRNGIVEKIDDTTYRFIADVYDAGELIPWIRTFIGRIEKFDSSNKDAVKRFRNDMIAMRSLYEGGEAGV